MQKTESIPSQCIENILHFTRLSLSGSQAMLCYDSFSNAVNSQWKVLLLRMHSFAHVVFHYSI